MELYELRTGYIVELRNGSCPMVIRAGNTSNKYSSDKDLFYDGQRWLLYNFDSYNEDMSNKLSPEYDIMKVFSIKDLDFNSEVLLWERKED